MTGLTNGQRYSFRVLARNSRGWSPPSNGAAAIPLSQLPHAPQPYATPTITNFDVAALTATATLEWMVYLNAASITHYVVQRSTDGSNWTSTTTPADHHPAQIYQDTGLAIDTVYRYRVASVNASGQSPWSTIMVVRTPTSCPDRSVSGYEGTVLVTQSFTAGGSCADFASEQDRVADKEITGNPDLWCGPECDPCVHERIGQTESTTSVRYTCYVYFGPPIHWFVITYPTDLVT